MAVVPLLQRKGMCGRCGGGWMPVRFYVWAAGTLSGWLCTRCELATRPARESVSA